MALGVLRTAYLLVDAFWVGRLGADALAALGGAAFGWWMVEQLSELAATGTHTAVAHAEGAGRRDRVSVVALHGLLVAACVSLVLWAGRHVFADAYFHILGFAEGTAAHAEGVAYFTAVLAGAGGVLFQNLVAGVYRGLGRTGHALAFTAVSVALNSVLDPWFIWGAGPIPALGIAGAAWATAVSSALGGLVGWIWLVRFGCAPRGRRVESALLASIVRIGAPMTISGVGFSLVYVVLGQMITSFGEAHMAALGVGHRIETIGFYVGAGFLVATATVVGQAIGAGQEQRVLSVVQTAERLVVVGLAVVGLMTVVAAEPLFALIAEDATQAASGISYLRIQAVVWAFMGMEMVYTGAFTGVARTVPAMWITAVLTLLRVPVAALLAWTLGFGVTGIWVAIAISTVAKGVLMRVWFVRVTWAESEPLESANVALA